MRLIKTITVGMAGFAIGAPTASASSLRVTASPATVSAGSKFAVRIHGARHRACVVRVHAGGTRGPVLFRSARFHPRGLRHLRAANTVGSESIEARCAGRHAFARLRVTAAAAAAAVRCDDQSVDVEHPSDQPPLQMAGTFCRPGHTEARAVFVLVPGATYNRAYWDFPYDPDKFSFARAVARAGFAAFSIDRLGTGASSRPPSATVDANRQADALHAVIGRLRGAGLDGGRYDTVLLGGHSFGSGAAITEAGTYHDVDGLLVSSFALSQNFAQVGLVFGSLVPAPLDPQLQARGGDLGYLTTRPGTRAASFEAPAAVDEQIAATDEQTKDDVAAGELAGAPELASQYTDVTAPVLLAVGGKDKLLCGKGATACDSGQALFDQQHTTFPRARCVAAAVMPDAGHDINLHESAPNFQALVIRWADRVAAGTCPSGPDQAP